MKLKTSKFKNVEAALFVGSIILFLILYIGSGVVRDGRTVEETVQERKPPQKVSQIDVSDVVADAFIVLDLSTDEILYARNPDAQLPLASLTKIMTIITALESIGEDVSINISATALAEEGDSGLFAGDGWRLGELAALTLIDSSNDGAQAIAVSVEKEMGLDFVEEMNRKAHDIGLSQTYFLNPTGLDELDMVSTAFGSAMDVITMLRYGLSNYPNIFEKTRYDTISLTSENDNANMVENTNLVIYDIPALLSSKTGFTDSAGGNVAVIFEAGPGRPIGVAILGSSQEGRFDALGKLVGQILRDTK